jgi:hypothetical protein
MASDTGPARAEERVQRVHDSTRAVRVCALERGGWILSESAVLCAYACGRRYMHALDPSARVVECVRVHLGD